MFNQNIRILVVDDMMTMRKLVAKCLREIGFTSIVEAANGSSAWEVISSSSPPIELVISDWNMPQSTGMDLLKRVRADSRFSNLPFVLVTAESEQKQVLEAMTVGVDGYIVKPFTAQILKDKLLQVHTKKMSA